MTRVKWCRKSTRNVSQMLTKRRTPASHSSVGRKLKRSGYSLRSNRKRLSQRQSPNRDQQFRHIDRLKRRYLCRGLPVISVDAKKRELVGPFKNAGRVWCREPEDVSTYDYPSEADGVAIPYGVYDVGLRDGFVVVGTSRNTPAFAVNTIRRWWRDVGRKTYACCREILILADAGGSNAARTKAWKQQLGRLATDYGLRIRVAHYPTGASKWNPVEHRLFSAISVNWAGVPLRDYETICGLIRDTRTPSGRRCRVRLDTRYWPTAKEVQAMTLRGSAAYHAIHKPYVRPAYILQDWNYTVMPSNVSAVVNHLPSNNCGRSDLVACQV
jgi:hypothetical protein